MGLSLQPAANPRREVVSSLMLLKERLGEAEMGPDQGLSALGLDQFSIMGVSWELSSIPGPTSLVPGVPRAGKHWAACTASLPCLLARVNL